jgi:hypothetical protein
MPFRLKRVALHLGVVWFFIGVFSTAFSVTVELGPSQDNTIYSENNNSNGSGTNLFAGKNQAGSIRRALLAFDLTSAVPSDATIDSVSLRLVVNRTQAGNESASLHRLTSDWGEGSSNASGAEGQGTAPSTGDATWAKAFFNTVSWNSGGEFVTQASATATAGSSAVTWSSNMLVQDVRNWLDGVQENYGWILKVNESSNQTTKRFNSRENSSVANRPKLTIEYTVPKSDQSISFDAIPDQVLQTGSITLSATASSGLAVSFAVISGPATLNGNILTFTGAGTVTIRASQEGNEEFNSVSKMEQSFEINSSIDTWLSTHFTEEELLDPSISGDDADPDLDSLPNIIEFALGFDPRSPSILFTGDASLAFKSSEGQLRLTFSRNPDAFDVTITVEESSDLSDWTAVASSVNGAAFQTLLEGYVVSEANGEGSIIVELIRTFSSSVSGFQRITVEW